MSLKNLFNETVSGPWTTGGIDVQYRVERVGEHATVFFEYTQSAIDVGVDADIRFTSAKRAKELGWIGFRGVQNAYDSVASQILEALRGCSLVSIRGYSLGAAFAKLLHKDVYECITHNVATICIGGFNPHFWLPKKEREAYEKASIINIRVRGDIVTLWPFLSTKVGINFDIGPRRLIPHIKYHFQYLEYLQKLDEEEDQYA